MNTRTEATEGQAKIREALERMLHVGGKLKTSLEKVYEFNTKADRSGAEFNRKEWDALEYVAHEALAALDASPPIVGELTEKEIERIALYVCARPAGDGDVTWEPDEVSQCMAALRKAREQGYLAQAPQSSPAPGVQPDGIMNEGYIEATRAHGSPAPSVIEAGDAMENMMRRLRTQRDDEGILPTGNDFNGMDGLCAAWVAAKASRPSVTAPQGVTVDQIKGVISEVDDMHPYKVAGNADSYSSYNEGWSDACGIIEGRLSALLTNPK